MFTEDLFQSTSLMDLLQTAPDVGISSYIITEDNDDNLALPQMLPNLMSEPMSPSDASVNVLDMVSQDMLLENSFQSAGASTEVTYASQYAACSSSYSMSAAPFTSAGDVFLPSLPITTASNTFVKPLHMFVKHSSASRNTSPLLKPTQRLDSRTETSKSNSRSDSSKSKSRSENSCSESRLDKKAGKNESSKPSNVKTNQQTWKGVSEKLFEKNTLDATLARAQSTKSRNYSGKTSTKSNKAHILHSIIKTLNRSLSGKYGAHSKGQSVSLVDFPQKQSCLVADSTHGVKARSAAVTHTVTRPTNLVSESAVACAIDTVAQTTTTVSHTVTTHQDGYITSSLKTASVTSYSVTRTQSPMTVLTCTRTPVSRSDSLTTSSLTSYSISKPRGPISIISPMQSAYTLPTSMLYPSPTIISRKSAAGAASPCETAASPPCDRLVSGQSAFVIPASGCSPTAADDTAPRSRTRYVIPVTLGQFMTSSGIALVTTTATVTKPPIAYPIRPSLSAYVTNVHTRATTATVTTALEGRSLTQSTFTLPPGATLYAARKISSSRSPRSRTTPVTTESQTFAFVDRKGSYTTLTISSDFTSTTGSSLAATHTTNTVTAGVSSHTTSVPLDSRPRNQFIIPIANSQMSTSTSLGYLVTSPIGSDIIGARGSTGAVASAAAAHGTTTTAATIGPHTITTISSETLNRIRNRILIPGTATLNSLQRHDEASVDRSRTPVTIIANQLITGPASSDVPMADIMGASQISTATRALFSATATQGLYAITTPVTSASPTAVAEPASRRVVVQVSSNTQSSVVTTAAGSTITTRALPAIPTPGTYIIATGMASSPTGTPTSKPSRIVLPTVHNATIAMTSTTVATTMSRPFPGAASGSAVSASQMSAPDAHSRLRNQLIVQVSTTESCMPGSTTPITAYKISRSRAPHNVYAIPGGSSACTSMTKHADATAKNTPTMTLITFATSSAAAPTTGSVHSSMMTTSARCDPSPATTFTTTVCPALDSARNRFVIKLSMSPSTTPVAQSSVTAAIATPITTAALSPSEHQFLEPRQVSSRLRTFPAPRTYSLAQRSAVKTPPRPSVRNVSPRVKKCLTAPAPLQIFADVVCPPTTVQSHCALTGQSKPRFALSQGATDSALAAHCKGAVFNNMLSVSHSSPERTGSHLLSPRGAIERVALVPPQRAGAVTRSSPRLMRPAYSEARPNPPPLPPAAPAPQTPTSPSPLDWAIPSPVLHDDTNQ